MDSSKAIQTIFGILLLANFIISGVLLTKFNNLVDLSKNQSESFAQQIQELKDLQDQDAQLLKATQAIMSTQTLKDAVNQYNSPYFVPAVKTPFLNSGQ